MTAIVSPRSAEGGTSTDAMRTSGERSVRVDRGHGRQTCARARIDRGIDPACVERGERCCLARRVLFVDRVGALRIGGALVLGFLLVCARAREQRDAGEHGEDGS